MQPGRGRIDDDVEAGQRPELVEGRRTQRHPVAELREQRRRSRPRAIRDDELTWAGAEQRRHDPARRAAMGAYGRRRVENELEWRYEIPKLRAAYRSLWQPARRAVPRPGEAA